MSGWSVRGQLWTIFSAPRSGPRQDGVWAVKRETPRLGLSLWRRQNDLMCTESACSSQFSLGVLKSTSPSLQLPSNLTFITQIFSFSGDISSLTLSAKCPRGKRREFVHMWYKCLFPWSYAGTRKLEIMHEYSGWFTCLSPPLSNGDRPFLHE